MKIAITTVYAVAALLFTTLGAASVAAEPQAKPSAVYYHADWCPNCQALSPKFQQAINGIDGLNVLVMDYTNMETTGESQKKALNMGLFEIVANNRHTGYVQMLDASGQEIGRLFRTSSVKEIRQQLNALASGS